VATISTGYSAMSTERWFKYLHQSPEGCSLRLDARLGCAKQLAIIADAMTALVKKNQQCPAGANSPLAPPTAISLASNNLVLEEALSPICSLCAACPELKSLDLSYNRQLFSVPLEHDAANNFTSLFFCSSRSQSSSGRFCGEVLLQGHLGCVDANVLDSPLPEHAAVAAFNTNASASDIEDGTTIPSKLQSLALNGNIIGSSATGLLSGCLLRQQHNRSDKECGLQELHLADAEMDSAAFCELLWGHAPFGVERLSQHGNRSGADILSPWTPSSRV
jgi:hypothetical protein